VDSYHGVARRSVLTTKINNETSVRFKAFDQERVRALNILEFCSSHFDLIVDTGRKLTGTIPIFALVRKLSVNCPDAVDGQQFFWVEIE